MREKPLVLLVDDNEATCVLVTAILKSRYEVEVASNGDEALEKLKSRRYAVILLDLVMPRTDGFAVLAHLEETAREVLKSVVVLTASLTPTQLDRVRQFDVCDIVRKPFEVEVLLSRVDACAGRSAPGAALMSAGPLMLLVVTEFLRKGC